MLEFYMKFCTGFVSFCLIIFLIFCLFGLAAIGKSFIIEIYQFFKTKMVERKTNDKKSTESK
jgi:hypothetical protein